MGFVAVPREAALGSGDYSTRRLAFQAPGNRRVAYFGHIRIDMQAATVISRASRSSDPCGSPRQPTALMLDSSSDLRIGVVLPAATR